MAIHGWVDSSGVPIDEALSIVEKLGGKEIIYTNIGRDGTMEGVDLQKVKLVMAQTNMKVIASGGVTTIEDIKKLKNINSPGCVVGKAIYEGKLDLQEALKVASEKN